MTDTKATSPSPGVLYGIGVGPGDPELIPVKSVRLLQTVDVIFTASSSKNQYSMAVRVAGDFIPEGADVRLLPFPMTMDQEIVRKAWQEHADHVVQELNTGRNAAFLTLGDPLTYSTFGYLLRIILKDAPHIRVETIPGITSYQAAAAATNTPLVEGEENLLLLSGVNGGGRFRQMADLSDNVVFLKAYKNMPDIARTLAETGRLGCSLGVVRCGLPDQKIYRDLNELSRSEPRYWTLIISKNKPIHED